MVGRRCRFIVLNWLRLEFQRPPDESSHFAMLCDAEPGKFRQMSGGWCAAPSAICAQYWEAAWMALGKRLLVEGVGTAWVVFVGCGSIVLNTGAVQQGYGVLEVSLAFGLALATASYAFGAHLRRALQSGCHDWLHGRAPFPGSGSAALHCRSDSRGHRGRSAARLRGERPPRLRTDRERIRGERFWRPFSSRLSTSFCAGRRACIVVRFRPGKSDDGRPAKLAADRTAGRRRVSDDRVHGVDSGYQRFDQSRPLYRPGVVRRRLGTRPALAVLGCAVAGRRRGRCAVFTFLRQVRPACRVARRRAAAKPRERRLASLSW